MSDCGRVKKQSHRSVEKWGSFRKLRAGQFKPNQFNQDKRKVKHAGGETKAT